MVLGILYTQWMVIRMQPQPVLPWPGPGCVLHLGTNHTIRLWLGDPFHFIHISGQLHTYKKCLAYFMPWMVISMPPTQYEKGQGSAVCHIWVLTTWYCWLWPRTTLEWLRLPSYTYIKCLNTFWFSGWSSLIHKSMEMGWSGWIWVTTRYKPYYYDMV